MTSSASRARLVPGGVLRTALAVLAAVAVAMYFFAPPASGQTEEEQSFSADLNTSGAAELCVTASGIEECQDLGEDVSGTLEAVVSASAETADRLEVSLEGCPDNQAGGVITVSGLEPRTEVEARFTGEATGGDEPVEVDETVGPIETGDDGEASASVCASARAGADVPQAPEGGAPQPPAPPDDGEAETEIPEGPETETPESPIDPGGLLDEAPQAPGVPDPGGEPDAPGAPPTPDAPDTGDEPNVPDPGQEPDVPDPGQEPDVPDTGQEPPETPGTPETETPEVPQEASHSVSVTAEGDAELCASAGEDEECVDVGENASGELEATVAMTSETPDHDVAVQECPDDQTGAVLAVSGLDAGATVEGAFTGQATVGEEAQEVDESVGPVEADASGDATVSLCASASGVDAPDEGPGVPETGTPEVPGDEEPGQAGLLQLIQQLISGLLGGTP